MVLVALACGLANSVAFNVNSRAQSTATWPTALAAAHDGPPSAASVVSTLPTPVYWRQTLFQIPYQWGSAAEPGAAHVVWLLVSKDHGATWQKISEAKPHVTSFSYRAEGEGEYWFAVRTLDRQGRQWPAGDYQPELRVIVDTTMPRIETLQASLRADGAVDIQWHGSDLNLDPNSWRIEAQTEALGSWQPVQRTESGEPGAASFNIDTQIAAAALMSHGTTVWQPPAGQLPISIRATLLDRAGNSATFQTQVSSAAAKTAAIHRLPPADALSATKASSLNSNLFDPPTQNELAAAAVSPPVANLNSSPQGWSSSSAAPAASAQDTQPADQPWPPSAMARTPFRLSNGGTVAPNDAVTTYGNPTSATATHDLSHDAKPRQFRPSTHDRYALHGEPHDLVESSRSPNAEDGLAFQPLAPYRQASIARVPENGAALTPPDDPYAPLAAAADGHSLWDNEPPAEGNGGPLPPGVRPKLVGSRTFALEYELEKVGRWGVSNVELWGTRDGGQTWRSFARDEDQRSPMVVTVDEEGLYGFRIMVESSGTTAVPPMSGDEPELWVAVDLNRPVAELTAIQPGDGNLADHLILRWRAVDDNLVPRPISLFFSSRPTGPWSAIATSLENTGEYAWRVERHVPTRFFLRLEARDTAGNLAAFQTREPIEFSAPAPAARLHGAAPVDPTATGGGVSYR